MIKLANYKNNFLKTSALNIKRKNHVFECFSLAELLITISIIGIIAGFVIPAIFFEMQEAQFKTAWKKAYADISQATIRTLQDNGGTFFYMCPYFDSVCLRDKYLPYLSYIKICTIGNTYGNCWHKLDGSAKYLNGNGVDGSTYDWDGLNSRAGIILNDGKLVNFMYKFEDGIFNQTSEISYGYIHVDINGFKGPNTVGKDIFGITLYTNFIRANGSPSNTYILYKPDTCSISSYGWGCSALYLRQ